MMRPFQFAELIETVARVVQTREGNSLATDVYIHNAKFVVIVCRDMRRLLRRENAEAMAMDTAKYPTQLRDHELREYPDRGQAQEDANQLYYGEGAEGQNTQTMPGTMLVKINKRCKEQNHILLQTDKQNHVVCTFPEVSVAHRLGRLCL